MLGKRTGLTQVTGVISVFRAFPTNPTRNWDWRVVNKNARKIWEIVKRHGSKMVCNKPTKAWNHRQTRYCVSQHLKWAMFTRFCERFFGWQIICWKKTKSLALRAGLPSHWSGRRRRWEEPPVVENQSGRANYTWFYYIMLGCIEKGNWWTDGNKNSWNYHWVLQKK